MIALDPRALDAAVHAVPLMIGDTDGEIRRGFLEKSITAYLEAVSQPERKPLEGTPIGLAAGPWNG